MSTTLAFAVRRRSPELVCPASPTPHDTKRLSDLDDQAMLRLHVRLMFFFRGRSRSAATADPAAVIRRAVAESLVPYYPLAGRLREEEEETGKLVVDCTGELGVTFVEADADVRLAELEAHAASPGGVLTPPFPCMDELLFDDVAGDGSGGGVLGCPLLAVQVTRLLCGGFVLALRLNHTMCDAQGIAQFVSAVADLARGGGLTSPTVVAPVWSRDLLESTRSHHRRLGDGEHADDDVVPPPPPPPPRAAGDDDGDMVVRTFTFAARDVAAIKSRLPPRIREEAAVTSFEAVTAALWRARTAALEVPADEEVGLAIIADCRRVRELGIPDGYYGNAIANPVARAAAGALLLAGGDGGLGKAVELVREAKAAVTAEQVRAGVDALAVLRRRGGGWTPELATTTAANMFVVSDNRHAGFHRVDFGWGLPVFGGVVTAVFGVCFLVAVRGGGGDGEEEEDAVAVPIVLPRPAMDRFASEIEMMLSSCCPVGSAAPAPAPPRGRL